jgi:hypothetical protein
MNRRVGSICKSLSCGFLVFFNRRRNIKSGQEALKKTIVMLAREDIEWLDELVVHLRRARRKTSKKEVIRLGLKEAQGNEQIGDLERSPIPGIISSAGTQTFRIFCSWQEEVSCIECPCKGDKRVAYSAIARKRSRLFQCS